LKKIAESAIPVVLYESPHRILKLLGELSALGIPRVTIARELTKMHEELLVGTPTEMAANLTDHDAARGEFTVIVEPPKAL
jgi:16S rRNA (cytidine1402-2'-O)-methyltransferase